MLNALRDNSQFNIQHSTFASLIPIPHPSSLIPRFPVTRS
jgi:hypothetical protein